MHIILVAQVSGSYYSGSCLLSSPHHPLGT